MKHDAIFRLRLPREELEALKRVAKLHRQPASDYVRDLIWEKVKRADAALRVREMLAAARLPGPRAGKAPPPMTEEEAMALADEAKHASRR